MNPTPALGTIAQYYGRDMLPTLTMAVMMLTMTRTTITFLAV
jgi:hypothetical protein